MSRSKIGMLLAVMAYSTGALSADWKPVPSVSGIEYDAASIEADRTYAKVWLRDTRGIKWYQYMNCSERKAGQLNDSGWAVNVRSIEPDSLDEKLMVLCKSKWQVWK
jgi:hypothetical protein